MDCEMNLENEKLFYYVRQAALLDAVIAYCKSCDYSPDKKVIFEIAGVTENNKEEF